MIIVLSPAKSLDYATPPTTKKYTEPRYLAQSAGLVALLKPYSPAQLRDLMKLSDPLAALNVTRYADWHTPFTLHNAKQAVLAFNGDVYDGLNAASLSLADLNYAQHHLRILSGLYGLLRPLDLIQPYRLEMGTRLPNPQGKDLYAYWGTQITAWLQQDIDSLPHKKIAKQPKYVINLASEEYFKAVQPTLLRVPVITPVFEDQKNGQYKVISFYAKRARGLMARYIIEGRLNEPTALQDFHTDGYVFYPQSSTATRWVFRRKEQA